MKAWEQVWVLVTFVYIYAFIYVTHASSVGTEHAGFTLEPFWILSFSLPVNNFSPTVISPE